MASEKAHSRHAESLPEPAVVDAFCNYIEGDGWTATRARGRDYCDVRATRHGIRLYAEVKGHTRDLGTDADSLYGQLLRRMTQRANENLRYAIVIPEGRALASVLRVPLPNPAATRHRGLCSWR